MSFPPWHEVYSKSLLGAHGYPLSSPQLNTELRESYQLEGLRIGDVGILSPNDGSFDVLFNITLPRNEQPYPDRVREDFMPITLIPQRDLNTRRGAVSPTQCVFPHGSIRVQSVRVHDRNQEPSRADYEFSLSIGDGAVLVLPEGADKCDLENENIFLDAAIRHGAEWYECATDPKKAGRLINNNSLYLITGFHKARSWSLGATAQSGSGLQNQHSLKFEVGETREDGVTARAYRWEIVQGFMGCVGPEYPYEIPRYITDERRHGVNQTVFIRGFWITINDFLIFKTVSVKTPERTYGGLGAYVKNLMWGGSESTSSPGGGDAIDNEVNQDFRGSHSRLYADARMTIDRVPNASQTFHPGDSINRYMLKKEPHAMIAVTHDSLWIEMLQKGILEIADFFREKHLEEVLSKSYRLKVQDAAVHLQKYHTFESQPDRSCTPSVATEEIAKQPESTSGQFLLNIDGLLILDLTAKIVRKADKYVAGGAFGDVYECMLMSDGMFKEVAVKAFRFKFASLVDNGTHADKMVHRELGIWRRLNHKNIVPFLGVTYGFGLSGNISLVSLWMPNGSLHHFLKRFDDTLKVTHRLQLLLDISKGLSYLHSFPIVHGDLNPNNVLLDADYTARLVDFGYSTVTGDLPEAMHYLQRSTQRPGALRWMPPDCLESESDHSFTTQYDIYSFGCMALMVLSGKEPWSEIRADAAIILQLATGRNPGRPLFHPIDDGHWGFIEWCWSPVGARPLADDAVASIQQFLSCLPPSHPLGDILVPPSPSVSDMTAPYNSYRSPGDHPQHPLDLPDLTPRLVQIDKHNPSWTSSDVCRCQITTSVGVKEVAVKTVRFKFTANKDTSVGKSDGIPDLANWSKLNHPNIVPFLGVAYGFGGVDHVSLVSLWMSNGSLQDFLDEYNIQLTIVHRLCLLSDIANGLLYLHSIPIIHGRLSPYNVLLDENCNACLTDIGYSSIELQDPGARPTAVWWAAPELVTKTVPRTAKSDIYSFGNLALQVLFGIRPWSELTDVVALQSQMTMGRKPGRPESHPVEAQHWKLIEHCWSSPPDRPASKDVASSIQKFLDAYPSPRPLFDVLFVPDLTHRVRNPNPDEGKVFQGNFSNVYKCLLDSELGTREVAVKTFRFKFTVEKEWNRNLASKRMHHTLNMWRSLDHPNIVQFYGFAYEPGSQTNTTLVSLWMPNGTLSLFLERNKDWLSVEHRLQLLLDVANGLQYLHSIPIIHGDLSPNNVLLDCNYTARLTDFDYTSFVGNRNVYLAASTLRAGSLRWTAPELMEESPEYTTKNDIFPFGNLAFLVLSGQYPWSNVRQDAVVLLRLAEGRRANRPTSPPIDDQHWGLIERCWSLVKDRPPAEAVVHDIQKFVTAHSPPRSLRDLLDIAMNIRGG